MCWRNDHNRFLQMGKQLDSFKHYLEDFAAKHKSDIKKNPEFRGHFQKMCARIGVDPLACMWNSLKFSDQAGINLMFLFPDSSN